MPDGTIYLVEIESRTLTRVSNDGVVSRIADLGGGPNGLAMGPGGLLYVCNNGGLSFLSDGEGSRPILQADDYSGGCIQRFSPATGGIELLYGNRAGQFFRGPNDIVFDRHGGFYFTDLGKTRAEDMDRGWVYYARSDGSSVRRIIGPMMTPNGIGLSPDGTTLYVAETQTARLWAWTVLSPGEVDCSPFPSPHGGRLVCGLPGFQMFDSMAVEANGYICVATLFESGITVISPDGDIVEKYRTDDLYTTNICFGGDDRRTAYITLSHRGELIAVDWARPGLELVF